MTMRDREEKTGFECPYCGSNSECVHMLLCVDMTFLEVAGGILLEAFDKRWSALYDPESDDAEVEADRTLKHLLPEVGQLADKKVERTEHTGWPAVASTYQTYYVSSEAKAKKALKLFTKAVE